VILVRVYCKAAGCGRLLASVPTPVPAGATAYRVRPCPRHGGTVAGFLRLARPGKKTSLGFGPLRVPMAVLAPLIREAERTGRTQTHVV
jgi:hypothetical protein